MIDLEPFVQRELWIRRAMLTVIAMLVIGCGILAFGWWNSENDKAAMLGLFNRVATIIEDAEVVRDSLRAGISDENQRVFLEGSRKLLEDRP